MYGTLDTGMKTGLGLLVIGAFTTLLGTAALRLEMRGSHKHVKSEVFLIRHGEKVNDDSIGLSADGESRAKCLANKFSEPALKPEYVIGTPPHTARYLRQLHRCTELQEEWQADPSIRDRKAHR